MKYIKIEKICEQFNITEDEYYEMLMEQAENRLKK